MATSFYETIESIVKTTPNSFELGEAVRRLVIKIQDSKKEETKDSNQVSIFDEIKERKNER